MSAYIITNSELVAIANAIRNKNSSNETFTLEQIPNAIATIGESIGSGAVVKNPNNDKYIVNDVKLINIANAIRNKLNISDKITVANMPNLINSIQTNYTINYYNGNILLKSEEVTAGADAIYSGTTPTKTQDAQYTYSFAGWSKDDDNTVDSDALTNIVADRNVYACFTSTLRKYTVTFVRSSIDGSGTLQTINNVNYGTIITAASSYTGATPTTSQGSVEDYPFEGWEPASATVQGDTVFTAKFGAPVVVEEITDSWDTIIANIDNGTYATKYKIGNYKPLDLGTQGIINMQIVAMDADELASGGTAPLTFVGMELLNTGHSMNTSAITTGGWQASSMRSYLIDTILPLVPTNVRDRIIAVKKYSSIFENDTQVVDGQITYDRLWIPSHREIFDSSSYESQGIAYSSIYSNAPSRIKGSNNWWLRSVNNANRFYVVTPKGKSSFAMAYLEFTPCIGFCMN